MGGVCAAVYLLLMILFMPFLFYSDIKNATADSMDHNARTDSPSGGRVSHKFPVRKVRKY